MHRRAHGGGEPVGMGQVEGDGGKVFWMHGPVQVERCAGVRIEGLM